MRWLIIGLLVCLLFLQFRLWVGDGSLQEVTQLKQQITQQTQDNQRLQQRNLDLAKQVQELKTGLKTIEARARQDMGMIKDGETFYMVIDKEKQPNTPH